MNNFDSIKLNSASRVILGLGIVALFYFPLFLHLDSKPLREWDEARNAINAFEMSQTGDYMVKTYQYNADLWETKPPLLVWLQVLNFKLFGYNELSVRLPSALAGFSLCIFLCYYFYKKFNSIFIGFFSSLVLLSSNGYIHTHAARTGDHDSLLILFSILMLFAFFEFLEHNKRKHLFATAVFFTLSVYTKSIAVFMLIPGILFYTILNKKLILTLKNKTFWITLGGSFFVILLYYFARELVKPGYLKAVWNNELFPRYFNNADKFQYNETGFWFYLNELIDWQFTYWFYFLIPSIAINFWLLKDRLRKFFYYISCVMVCFYLIISTGTSNVWYDLPLIPLFSITIGLAVFVLFQKLYKISINAQWLRISLICASFGLVFYPYKKIIEKVLSTSENNGQVMYAYAFKKLEKDFPEIKNIEVFEPLNFNYPLVFYSHVFNECKNYKIKFVTRNDIRKENSTVVLLEDQYSEFEELFKNDSTVFKGNNYRIIHLKGK